MDSKSFFNAVEKHEIKRVYLLHGDEEYAKDRALEALCGVLDENIRDFNLDICERVDVDSIREYTQTKPMMSGLRIIIVRDDKLLQVPESTTKKLIDLIVELRETVCLVFVIRGKADARKALYKAITKVGDVTEFAYYSEYEAARWAVTFAKRRGVIFPLELAHDLVMMIGRPLGFVSTETTKLCDFAGKGNTITEDMIQKLVVGNLEYTVFEMLEHFLGGRTAQAVKLYQTAMLEEGASGPIKLCAFFASRLRNMLIARIALDHGKSDRQAATEIGGNAYAAKKSVAAAKQFQTKQIQDALVLLANYDIGAKTGQLTSQEGLLDVLLQIFRKVE